MVDHVLWLGGPSPRTISFTPLISTIMTMTTRAGRTWEGRTVTS